MDAHKINKTNGSMQMRATANRTEWFVDVVGSVIVVFAGSAVAVVMSDK